MTAAPPALMSVAEIKQQCHAIRQSREELRMAFPIIRLWINENIDGPAVCIGRVDYTDTIKGSFPFKNNTPTQGVLQIRDDHYVGVFLKSLPNDPAYCKNVLITVDFYGGEKRWSGLLDKWNVRQRDGVKYMELTFNDDLTFLQYLLCPPNPLLPIDIFQFPRVFALAGPSRWAISLLILINLIRVEGNLWTIPDDPFDLNQWFKLFDWSSWQILVRATPFLQDGSLWTFFASRMNPIDSIIADTLDDAQLTIKYRRILTDDGETIGPGVPGVSECQNGALVFEVDDNSGLTGSDGTYTGGDPWSGFWRSVIFYIGGFVEDTLGIISDDESLTPDEYYSPGFLGTIASHPWMVIRDNEWTPIESADLSWGPSKAVSVIIGGDNPAADAIARLIIETVGDILGYVLLLGFSSAGQIAADAIMPFIVGTIAAWIQWKNTGRATELGWIHYLEMYQQGAENSAWSLSGLAALRGGFLVGKSETDHLVALHDFWAIPGIHFDVGNRIGTTVDSSGLQQIIWVNQVEEMNAAWDNSGDVKPYAWEIKAGKSQRNLSMGERLARLSKKLRETATNLGASLIQG